MTRVFVVLLFLSLVVPAPAQADGAILTRAAPDFRVTDLDGRHFSLSGLRGQAVIVLFGDVGCAPCRDTDRLLRQYQLEYLTHGLVVISLNEHATLDEARRYDDQFEFSMVMGVDSGHAVARRYHALVLPTTVFIDRQGLIQGVRHGRLTEDQLLQELQRLL